MQELRMKMIAFALLGMSVAGCSDEADIGVDSAPVTCTPDQTKIAEVAGSVRNPFDGSVFQFDAASPTAMQSPNNGASILQLASDSLLLRFSFYCGPTEVARYGVIGDTQQQLECPFEVASAMYGQIEYLPASEGVMIVDEASNCLAGRFRVDFGSDGAIGGSFSAPWE
jgi:hypothetical protein